MWPGPVRAGVGAALGLLVLRVIRSVCVARALDDDVLAERAGRVVGGPDLRQFRIFQHGFSTVQNTMGPWSELLQTA